MPEAQTLSLLFYRGTGVAAEIEREFCKFPFQRFEDVPGHVAVEVGGEVSEAVEKGVCRLSLAEALSRPDLIHRLTIPGRTPEQIASAKRYADACVSDGEPYSWGAIRDTVLAWADPGCIAALRDRLAKSTSGTICCLFALLVCEHAGCGFAQFFSPATTPNELMVRGEDFAAALASLNSDCNCSPTKETQ